MYVSTVDSGNLAGHLLTLRQGLLALARRADPGAVRCSTAWPTRSACWRKPARGEPRPSAALTRALARFARTARGARAHSRRSSLRHGRTHARRAAKRRPTRSRGVAASARQRGRDADSDGEARTGRSCAGRGLPRRRARNCCSFAPSARRSTPTRAAGLRERCRRAHADPARAGTQSGDALRAGRARARIAGARTPGRTSPAQFAQMDYDFLYDRAPPPAGDRLQRRRAPARRQLLRPARVRGAARAASSRSRRASCRRRTGSRSAAC